MFQPTLIAIQEDGLKEVNVLLQQILQSLSQPQSQLQQSGYMTVEQVAEHIKCSRQTVEKYRKEGKLSYYKIDGGFKYSLEDVETFMRTHKVEAVVFPHRVDKPPIINKQRLL